MSTDEKSAMQRINIARTAYMTHGNAYPTNIRVGRGMLDALAGESWQVMRRQFGEMTEEQFRDHFAEQARKGELSVFCMQVELCEGADCPSDLYTIVN